MAITEQHRKEDLGQAYVRAVIAKAGFNYGRDEHDYGFDGAIKEVTNVNGRYCSTGFGINYQLKSSCDAFFQGEYVVYDLESKNYNDLVTYTTTFPNILVLFALPHNENEWLSVTESELTIRQCAWWCSLTGKPTTDNKATKRICIQKRQLFTPEELILLMDKVKGGMQL